MCKKTLQIQLIYFTVRSTLLSSKRKGEIAMIRKIITIDKDKCNGCELCVTACHEGAIGMRDGKAILLRDDYCDGLGNCLPVCPTGAISFEEREALPFDEKAVEETVQKKMMDEQNAKKPDLPCGCPESHSRRLAQTEGRKESEIQESAKDFSELRQWPVQIQLVPVNAAYFKGAHLLIAADCAAYASGNFHAMHMKGKVCLIGCPKLDCVDYSEKLTAILKENDIRSVTVVRMEVPCCGGLEHATVEALKNCGKMIPWQVVILSVEGKTL